LTTGHEEAPLARVVRALAAAGVRYALIGAAARNAWAPPRLTTDLDVAVIGEGAEYAQVKDAPCTTTGGESRRARATGASRLRPSIT
jgi:hypothetical protein